MFGTVVENVAVFLTVGSATTKIPGSPVKESQGLRQHRELRLHNPLQGALFLGEYSGRLLESGGSL